MISREEILDSANISMLALNEDEIERIYKELNDIFEIIDRDLEEIDFEGIEATNFVNNRKQVLREDIVKESLTKEDALKNAPEEQYGYFKLLNVME